ncbi:MAG: 50S ribosomal protein L18Ae [Acidilobus sp.]
MSEAAKVKVFVVEGRMLLSHDKFPEWHNFKVFVTALKEKDALEKVYSDLGSRHKLKRYHIKVQNVREASLDEVTDAHILSILGATRVK